MAYHLYITRFPALFSLAHFIDANHQTLTEHYAEQPRAMDFDAWCVERYEREVELRERLRHEFERECPTVTYP